MTRTGSFRRQHDAAIELVGEIVMDSAELDKNDDAARTVGLKLARLTGILRIHFAQEDRMLYPSLMRSPDPETAATATRFFDEMGSLGDAYAAFAERWTMSAIREAPDAFRAESGEIFAVLADRIERENEQLYPLADRQGGESGSAIPAAA